MIMVTMMMPEPTLATSFHVSLAAKSKKKKKTHVELTISKEQYPYPCTGCMSYITNNRALTVAAWSRAKHMDIEADSPVGIFPEDAA